MAMNMEPVAVQTGHPKGFPLLELLSLGEKQGLLLKEEAEVSEGLARLEEVARRMGGRSLSAFDSVKNW